MFDHVQWSTLSWKVYKPFFLVSLGNTFESKKENKIPLSRASTRILTQYLIELQGQDVHSVMLEDTSKAFKEATEAQAPNDIWSSASLLDDFSDSQLEERRGVQISFPVLKVLFMFLTLILSAVLCMFLLSLPAQVARGMTDRWSCRWR